MFPVLPQARTGHAIASNSPLLKGQRQRHGGCLARSEDHGMRMRLGCDALNQSLPDYQDNPQAALPPPPLTKGEFLHNSPHRRLRVDWMDSHPAGISTTKLAPTGMLSST